jgi:hypothetical protein
LAYEKLVVHAIQRNDMKAFSHRFRIFTQKEDRDRTLEFLKANTSSRESDQMQPVKLTIMIEDDDILSLPLEWGEGG